MIALIKDQPEKASHAREKPQAIKWFVGQVMKQTDSYDPMIIKDMAMKLVQRLSQPD